MRSEVKTKFISDIRLSHFKDFDEYKQNMYQSEKYYILLSIFEVSLRNSIDNYFKEKISSNWLESEILHFDTKQRIIESKNKIEQRKEILTHDKIISELSFGFWTALFQSVYDDKMRFNNLKHIFPNLPPKEKLPIDRKMVSTKLNHIRKFRNRIFHHENILKEEFKNIEDDIYEILSYFDNELVEFTKKANNG